MEVPASLGASLPLVSIIITTYNYAHTVGTAIESALAQDYPNLEVVVMDNASIDETPTLVERYAADPRLRSIRNETNVGMVPNHNKGLRAARGAYVLFLSADDFLLPHHVSRSFAYLRDHPEVDVLYTAAYFADAYGRFIGLRQMTGQPLAPYAGGRNEFVGLLTEGCYMCFPTMLMRRDLYERYGELDEDIKAADYEVVVRWATKGVRFGYLPEATCVVRLHNEQQSSSQNYMALGADVREAAYLVKKFAHDAGPLLADCEASVSRAIWSRYQMALSVGAKDEDGTLRELLLSTDAVLADVKSHNLAQPRKVRPTVIVLPTSRINELEQTLRSLVAQTHADWEALVLDYPSLPFGDLGDYVDSAGRVRVLRLTTASQDGALLVNTALRVAAGNLFVVMRPGSVLPPEHLALLVAAVEGGHGEVIRSSAALAIGASGAPVGIPPLALRTDVFVPPTEPRLPLVAPCGPPESLAFSRRAIDAVGPANEAFQAFPEWELYLRLSRVVPVAALHSCVTAQFTAATETLDLLAALPAAARRIHAAYQTADMAIELERKAYLSRLEGALAAPRTEDPRVGLVRLALAAYGAELLAAVH